MCKSTNNRKHRRSLATKTAIRTAAGCVLLGVLSVLIGISLYARLLINQYIDRAFEISKFASASSMYSVDCKGVTDRIMSVFRSLSDEERAKVGSPEYSAHFEEISQSREYDSLLHILDSYIHTNNVSSVYLVILDKETGSMIYIADPKREYTVHPGDWEEASSEGMEKFLNWNGTDVLNETTNTPEYGWLITSGYPLTDDSSNAYAFVMTDVAPRNFIGEIVRFAVINGIAIILVTVAVVLFQIRSIKMTVVEPVKSIATAATRYALDKQSETEQVEDYNHFGTLSINTDDEIEDLADTMSDMEHDILTHEEKLTKITAENERISTELELAASIQLSALPSDFPVFSDRNEFELFASMTPAKEVGGDFYDFFLVDDDHLALVIADVSGKGVPAALFMMAAKMLINTYSLFTETPSDILRAVNERICQNNSDDMFVTVWLGILEISTGKLTCANAGHEYPALRKAGEHFTILKDKHSLAIGAMDGIKFKSYELQLEPGDILFVYTDGVPEATDANLELFGTERMREALDTARDASIEELLRTVKKTVDKFVGDAPQFDDLTMLAVRYNGK